MLTLKQSPDKQRKIDCPMMQGTNPSFSRLRKRVLEVSGDIARQVVVSGPSDALSRAQMKDAIKVAFSSEHHDNRAQMTMSYNSFLFTTV
jgi:hypothetical protein